MLVIGGAGFLGVNLVRRCLAGGDNQVTVVDSLDPRFRSRIDNLREVWSRIKFVQGDLRDASMMAAAVERQDVIFNCAAQTSHPLSLTAPLLDAEINCLGTLTLLEAVRARNPEAVVVYPSSSTVIGRAPEAVLDEDHAERPFDIYSANKAVAEKYHLIYHQVHDLRTVVLRFANLYGPYGKGESEFGFLNYFIHLASEGRDITVYGSGGQTRNVMFVADAAEILYRSAFQPALRGQVLFAAHDEHLTVCEIAEKIEEVFGRGRVVEIEWPEVRRRIEIDNVRISSARLRSLTDWRPRYSFAEGVFNTREIMERMARNDQSANHRSAGAYRIPAYSGDFAPAGEPAAAAR
ncbi:MAG: NAD-dependent epimerase/dehydratase family protein [Blastocatellia bacterium]